MKRPLIYHILLLSAVAVLGTQAFLSYTASRSVDTAPTPTPVEQSPKPTTTVHQTPVQPSGNQITPTQAMVTESPRDPAQEPSETFFYPGAIVTSRSSMATTLQVTADAGEVTEWYKNQIIASGMKSTAFVQTSTNGTIHTVLAGTGGASSIRITITQKAAENIVHIELTQ